MAFVRLSKASDYGKPYQSMLAAQQKAREDLNYVVQMMSDAAKEAREKSAGGQSQARVSAQVR